MMRAASGVVRFVWVIGVVGGVLGWGRWCGAQAAGAFDKGQSELHLTGSYLNGNGGFDDNGIDGGQLSLGAGYYFLDGLAGVAEVVGYGWRLDDNDGNGSDAYGVGLNALLRWHVLRGEGWSVYLDGGGGFVEYDQDFPAGGTHFNFTARVGLGATLRLTEDLHLMGGSRFFHHSNGGIEGSRRNPGIDTVEGYVGVMWVR